MYRALHLCDQHIPFQHRAAIDNSLLLAAELQPNAVVLGGDLVDCYALNRYRVRHDKFRSLRKELDGAERYLDALIDVVGPDCAIHYTLGNHEARVDKYIDRNAPALATLGGLSIREMLGCDEREISVYPYGEGIKIGDILFTHGSLVRKYGGVSVRGMIDSEGCSVAMGHSHRLACVTVRHGRQRWTGYESGCLCMPKQPYMEHTPDAQLGCSVFTFRGQEQATGSPIWTPVPLDDPHSLATVLEALAK